MTTKSELIRVSKADNELITRIAGAMTNQTAKPNTKGDVVAVAVRALLDVRPDLAVAVRDAKAAQ